MKCIIGRKNSLLLIGAKFRNVPLKNSNLPLLTSMLLYFISVYVMDQIWTWHVCTALTFVCSIYHVSSIWHVSWVNGDIRSDRISIHQIYSLFVCVYNSQKINPISQNATIFAQNTTVFARNTTVMPQKPRYLPQKPLYLPQIPLHLPQIPLYLAQIPLYLPPITTVFAPYTTLFFPK